MTRTTVPHERVPERSMPRTLAGWPEGAVYVPRKPTLMHEFYAAEREALPTYVKQSYGRSARRDGGDDE